jgi:hypothetical protein
MVLVMMLLVVVPVGIALVVPAIVLCVMVATVMTPMPSVPLVVLFGRRG